VTLRAWLRSRTPPGPERLLARIEEVLGDRCDASADEGFTLCLDAADALLLDRISRPSMRREAAQELHEGESLRTFAFVAAAMDTDSLAARGAAAMTRFGACAAA
jgi:hypothetical protein